MIKYRIKLTEVEREELKAMLTKGRHSARKLTRARILLLSDEGKTQEDIVNALGVGAAHVLKVAAGGAKSPLDALTGLTS